MEILVTLYLLVTSWALVMRYREQRETGQRNVIFNVIGYLACMVWPLVCAIFLVAMHRRSS